MFWFKTGIKSGGNLSTAIRSADNLDDNFFKSLKLDFSEGWLKTIKYSDFDDDFVKLLAKNVNVEQLKQISPENLAHISKKLDGDELGSFVMKLDKDSQETLFKQLNTQPKDLDTAGKVAKKLSSAELNNLVLKFPDDKGMLDKLRKNTQYNKKSFDKFKKQNELKNSEIKSRKNVEKYAENASKKPENQKSLEEGEAAMNDFAANKTQQNLQRNATKVGESQMATDIAKQSDTVNIYNSKPMKSSMKKIGLVGIGALVGVMIMYNEWNPFKAIRKAGEDLGKVMRTAKDAAIATAEAAGDTVGGLAKLISWITKNAHIPIVGSIICVVLMLAMYAYSSFSK